MITNSARTQGISSLGWIDRGGLLVVRASLDRPQYIKLSNARFLKLCPGRNDFFAVQHNFDNRIVITAHNHREPGCELSRVTIVPSNGWSSFNLLRVPFSGDQRIWEQLPKVYATGFSGNMYLFLVDGKQETVSVYRMDWYNEDYDKGYQGLADVAEVPGQTVAAVSIQRDSNLILYDLSSRAFLRRIRLAGRHGNPSLRFATRSDILWASDYDTIVKIDAKTWETKASCLLARPIGAMGQFIGEFVLTNEEMECLVARPFSGDVVVVNASDLRIKGTAHLGRQPLAVAILDNSIVVARDWTTGDVLKGNLPT